MKAFIEENEKESSLARTCEENRYLIDTSKLVDN